MVHRLIMPKDLRDNVLRPTHFNHNSKLPKAADVEWPQYLREIVGKARNCVECQQAGKKTKSLESQTEIVKVLEGGKSNAEVCLDFLVHFKTHIWRKYLLVSIDNH